jgi:hypothetical protein
MNQMDINQRTKKEEAMKIEGCPSCSSVGAAQEQQEDRVLKHWPLQIKLMGTVIPFLKDADLMVAADCTAFAVKEFHDTYLKDHKLLIGCPKLDNAQFYVDKFTEIFSDPGNDIKSLTVLRMEVPCCGGMSAVLGEALKRSGRTDIPFREIVVGVRGNLVSEVEVPLK